MSKISDFFHHLVSKAQSAETTLESNGAKFMQKVSTKIGPLGDSLLQLAVTEAGLVAAPWQVKLFSAVTMAEQKFKDHNIAADVNDIVAAITVIIDDIKATATNLETTAATTLATPTA